MPSDRTWSRLRLRSKTAQNCETVARNSFRHVELAHLAADKISSASSACLQTALGRFMLRSKTVQTCDTVARNFSLPQCCHSDVECYKPSQFTGANCEYGFRTPIFTALLFRRKNVVKGTPGPLDQPCRPHAAKTANTHFHSQFTGQNGSRAQKT